MSHTLICFLACFQMTPPADTLTETSAERRQLAERSVQCMQFALQQTLLPNERRSSNVLPGSKKANRPAVVARTQQASRLMTLADRYLQQLEETGKAGSLRQLYEIRLRLLEALGVRLRKYKRR
ncbi:MAG: hypothetical protein NXI04_16205 [Planctomycetaceae bacterium]|nr:hypothetical protein [Planctomycetaceae bacterium]